MSRDADPGRPRGGPQAPVTGRVGPDADTVAALQGARAEATGADAPVAPPETAARGEGDEDIGTARSGGARSAAGSTYGDWHGSRGHGGVPGIDHGLDDAAGAAGIDPATIGRDYASQVRSDGTYERGSQDFASGPAIGPVSVPSSGLVSTPASELSDAPVKDPPGLEAEGGETAPPSELPAGTKTGGRGER